MQTILGRWLANYLSKPRHVHGASPPTPPELLGATLKPGDVLLVEGNTRISTAIKYLTQSTWSHAALYVGAMPAGVLQAPDHCFVEADLVEGVRSISLGEYAGHHTRICRPVELSRDEIDSLCALAIGKIGHRYDLKNVVDLARYLLPTPPVPTSLRRKMIALGSGDPTKAICSTLIAQAFQSIGYPILPSIEYRPLATDECPGCMEEFWTIRHHSLYAPRDFDVSPYFQIVKPTADGGSEIHRGEWPRRR